MRLQFSETFKAIERSRDFNARFGKVLSHLRGGVADRLDVIKVDLVAGFFGEIDDVVQAVREEQDVGLIDWGDERAVDQVMDLMRSLITLVLQIP